jgi:zinc/manganese transport system permease protein
MLETLRFLLWPILACLTLPWLLVYCGLHIVRRGIIFVDLALAQVAALGTSIAILRGHHGEDWQTYAWSVSFTIVGAALFTLTRGTQRRVPQEALIGIVYVVAAAAGILVLSNSAEGNEQLRRMLVGEVLVVSPSAVGKTAALFAAIGVAHWTFRHRFLALTFESNESAAITTSERAWDFLFYTLFGFVVTSFVQIGGVLLTFSYLIVPAVCANFLVDSLKARIFAGWGVATVASLLGIWGSTAKDWPMGAAIVCALGLMLVLTMVASRFRHSHDTEP